MENFLLKNFYSLKKLSLSLSLKKLLFPFQVILDGINNMLKMAGQHAEQIANLIEECDGLSKIEDLQNHENVEIYKLAYDIIEQYFSDDVADDDAIQPAADDSGFQFNANQNNLEFNF